MAYSITLLSANKAN